jgi:hypothetical protein
MKIRLTAWNIKRTSVSEQKTNTESRRDQAMLALAINLLFAIAAVSAVLTLADCAIKARRAYDMLMHEKALMDAGFVLQVDPQTVRLRAAARHGGAVTLPRRSSMLRPLPALARGVA